MAVLLPGCPQQPRPSASESEASQLASLSFELPAGVSVSVDGQARGVTPIAALELSAASHRLVLTTACDEIEQSIVVQPQAETTIDRASVSALGFATVHVEAKTIRDKPLEVKLHLGETEVPGENGRFEIPACPARMRIEPTGVSAYNLGSFIEDIEPKATETLTRKLVLRPGPDVVRLHGGPFPSCSFEGGNGISEQGICDLAGNRVEFAVDEADIPNEKRHYVLGGEQWELTRDIARGSLPGDSSIGFRCVQTPRKNGEGQ